MKLFITNPIGQREYLNIAASTRQELANYVGSHWFTFHGNQYHVHQVVAAADSTNETTSGALIGGLIGLLGGPIGVLIGGTVGGVIGNTNDRSEIEKVNYFNRSTV
ncbi:MAG TPA: hypothetical protein VI757_07775 [Bacteroidia bacterium]|nr:hypothetical protein [Bacteroidia bacterium]